MNEDIEKFLVEKMGCQSLGGTTLRRSFRVDDDLFLHIRIIVDAQTFVAELRECKWERGTKEVATTRLTYTTLEDAQRELLRAYIDVQWRAAD